MRNTKNVDIFELCAPNFPFFLKFIQLTLIFFSFSLACDLEVHNLLKMKREDQVVSKFIFLFFQNPLITEVELQI